MPPLIRLASVQDAEEVAAIYAPTVRETAISFEMDPPDAAEMARRILDTLPRYPWLVCESGGEVLGYVYAGQHSARAAYQWSVNTAVYIDPGRRRTGIGRALYTALLKALPLQRFFNAYAGVTLPNAGSVGLHESLGFQPVGVYRSVGFKFGRWHDVGWWQLALQAHDAPAGAPLPLAEISDSPEFQAALAAGCKHLTNNDGGPAGAI